MKLIENGDIIRITNVTATPDKLEPGNYLLKVDPNGFYLQRKEPFSLPSKIYGDHADVDRWLKSYEVNSEKNLGIILSGMKGTGKTITCQILCKKANKPVIIINEPFHGSDFIDFITSPVFNDSIIFIDEYEKIYQKYQDGQNPHDFLQIMDGNYNTRLLFLLTVNEMNINEYLINRPGRVKYNKRYDNLPFEIVQEVIDDLLLNKEHGPTIFTFFETLGMITYDLLVCVIKEMNLFNEDALQVAKYLNLKPEMSVYDVTEIIDGKPVVCQSMNFSGSQEKFYVQRLTYFEGTPEKDYEDAEEDMIEVDTKVCDIKRVGLERITIITPEKHMFKLIKRPKFYSVF